MATARNLQNLNLHVLYIDTYVRFKVFTGGIFRHRYILSTTSCSLVNWYQVSEGKMLLDIH